MEPLEPLAINHLANSMHSHQRRNAVIKQGPLEKQMQAFLFLSTQSLHQPSSRFDKKVMWQLRKSFVVDTSTNPLNILECGTLPETVTQRDDRESQETFSCHTFCRKPHSFISLLSIQALATIHPSLGAKYIAKPKRPEKKQSQFMNSVTLPIDICQKKDEILHRPHPHTFQEHLEHPGLMEAPVLPSIAHASSCSHQQGFSFSLHTPKDIRKFISHRKDNTL